jgi:hypothetical protein
MSSAAKTHQAERFRSVHLKQHQIREVIALLQETRAELLAARNAADIWFVVAVLSQTLWLCGSAAISLLPAGAVTKAVKKSWDVGSWLVPGVAGLAAGSEPEVPKELAKGSMLKWDAVLDHAGELGKKAQGPLGLGMLFYDLYNDLKTLLDLLDARKLDDRKHTAHILTSLERQIAALEAQLQALELQGANAQRTHTARP